MRPCVVKMPLGPGLNTEYKANKSAFSSLIFFSSLPHKVLPESRVDELANVIQLDL